MPEALQQASSHQEHPAEGLRFDSASPEDVEQSNPTTATASEDRKPPHPIEKTISCVSCRRRKLKCDRVKPACGTCSRLRHECEYPERRRNLGAKRRNMKELEARLAQVETKLVAEANSLSNPAFADIVTIREQAKQKIDSKWKESTDVAEDNRADIQDGTRGRGQSEFDFDGSPSTALSEPFSSEVISLGLQEPLPTDEAQDELHRIFFDNIHISVPLMHKRRYFTKLKLGPNLRPPVCLQYIMWALAASVSDKYGHLEDVFYTRARRYAEAEEMKGYGEAFITVYHAQTWILISAYEAKKTLFTRAWMSTGKATRLVHMMGLYRLDGAALEVKQILSPAKDWIELEERRRTFWGAYYGDRWSSAGTGWPMVINESEILTNLPCSDEDFENGRETHSISLTEAMTGDGASKISSYAGVVLSATLFGHNFAHIHRRGPNEQPENQLRGEFWERHRRMDNTLTNTFMFLPQHLRLPQGLRDINVVFLNMNIHTAVICLHKAAIMTAEKHHLNPNFIRQSRSRCSMAAEEITNIMRLVSHVDAANMNSWMGFCLYVAGGVFIEDQRTHSNPQSASNLEFLVIAMKAIGKRHSITNHFIAQLIFDMEAAGIASRENSVFSRTGPVPSWKETNLMGSITESPNSECSPAVIEEPDHTKPSGQGCFTTCGINSPFPMSGMVQQDDQKATSQSPHASTPVDHLDNHFGITKDNTSRFFILSQEPRTKASSTSTTLHSSSNSLSGGVPQDGMEESPRDIDIRDSKARDRSKSVDPEHRIDTTPAGIQINSGFDRVPWITPNQQPGSTQSAAAYAAFRPGVVVPFGLQETDTRQNRNASRFIASPNQNRPVPQAQNLVSAPSPNVNLTNFTIREATKQPDYEMWNTQDIDTYSIQNGWNIDMNDVAMQDGFQMGTFDHTLREGDGVTDFLNGIGLSDWNRGGS